MRVVSLMIVLGLAVKVEICGAPLGVLTVTVTWVQTEPTLLVAVRIYVVV